MHTGIHTHIYVFQSGICKMTFFVITISWQITFRFSEHLFLSLLAHEEWKYNTTAKAEHSNTHKTSCPIPFQCFLQCNIYLWWFKYISSSSLYCQRLNFGIEVNLWLYEKNRYIIWGYYNLQIIWGHNYVVFYFFIFRYAMKSSEENFFSQLIYPTVYSL